jgi:NADPH2:quinone reductase
MRQVQLDEHGGPDVLHVVETADPPVGPGEVRIDVVAAGITFVETQMRAGTFAPPGAPPIVLPAVLGNGVEGTIAAVGEGVDPARIGQRVVSATGGLGGYRSVVVVPADAPVPVPADLPLGAPLAMLADGRTALAQVRVADLAPDDRVLVLAAAGGVGSLIVQLAVRAGATVVGAASGAAKADVVASLGARPLDYAEPGWADRVRADLLAIDVVFDGVGGAVGQDAIDLLDVGGRRVAFGMASGAWVAVAEDDPRGISALRGVVDGPEDNRHLVEEALGLAADGGLRALVGQSFAFEAAADAHRAIESRATVGKTILVP